MWPGSTVLYAHQHNGDFYADFRFPGGHATWRKDGLYVSVCDHPAWAAFTGKPVEIVGKQRG